MNYRAIFLGMLRNQVRQFCRLLYPGGQLLAVLEVAPSLLLARYPLE